MIAPRFFVRLLLSIPLMLLACDTPAQASGSDLTIHLSRLGDPDPAVCWRSMAALADAGSRAVPQLADALRDSDAGIRALAATALGRMGSQAAAAVPHLIHALGDSSARVREHAARALGEVGPAAAGAVDPLVLLLADPDPYVNGAAAEALGLLGIAAVPCLSRALTTGDANTRWCAAIALGKMGPEASPAVPALALALTDTSSDVRWCAAVALGNVGERARPAIPGLLDRLADPDQDVRRAAVRALDLLDPRVMESPDDWHAVVGTIDTLAPRLMEETKVPGLAIALIRNRTLVWSGAFGVADVRNGSRVADGTLFEACSMTKPVFAFLALKLVELGNLDLDRPLVEYLAPSCLRGQPEHERITARMVLSHTTGLPNWRKGEEERDGPLPVMFPPGAHFGYSGEAMYYLQRVIEKITGEPLDLYAHRTMLAPMGLARTAFAWREDLEPSIAAGHDGAGAFLAKSRYTHPNAAYSLYTSAADYARFLLAILNPDTSAPWALSPQTIGLMLRRHVPVAAREPIERPGRARGSEVFWGLGWSINATAAGDIVHHSGANRTGFRCFSQFNPSTGSGLVIMTNGTGGSDLWTRLVGRVGNL